MDGELMAKLTVGTGIDRYLEGLSQIVLHSDEDCKRAAYDGAKIVMDAVKARANAIPTVGEDGQHHMSSNHMQRGCTQRQKEGIINGLGIAHFRNDGGFINVKIGVDGYNNVKTKKYPNGQPNAMIARAVESGTSFRNKSPFIAPAVSSSRGAAERAMADTYDKQLKTHIAN